MKIWTLFKNRQKGGVFRITVHFREWFEKRKETRNKKRDSKAAVDRIAADEAYIKTAVKNNGSLLLFVSTFLVLIELYNMCRVLFMTKGVGISSPSNLIYFSFYASLFWVSVIYVFFERIVRMADEKRYVLHMAYGTLILLWQALFNIHDILRTNSQGNYTLSVIFMAFAAVFVMRPIYFLANIAGMYGLLLLLAGKSLSYGTKFNSAVMILLCVVIYYQKYRHLGVELTQRHEIEEAVKAYQTEHERFRLTYEQHEIVCRASQLITFEWNMKKGSVRFSEYWSMVLGQPLYVPDLEEFVKKTKRLQPHDKDRIFGAIEKAREKVPYQKLEIRIPGSDGQLRWYELSVTTQMDKEGEPIFAIGILRDIMEHRQEITRIRREAQTDPTGVLNKATIEQYGRERLAQLREEETLVALILDLDDFKYINDTMGHPMGDYVLSEIGTCMKKCALPGMCIGRIGGDEFLMLLAGARTLNVRLVKEYAEKLLEHVQSIKISGMNRPVRVSIGIAALDQESGMSFEELYAKADRALYQSKRAGKGRIKWAEDEVIE